MGLSPLDVAVTSVTLKIRSVTLELQTVTVKPCRKQSCFKTGNLRDYYC